MSFYDEMADSLFGGYKCPECGGDMEMADDTVLVCKECGYSVDKDDYFDFLDEDAQYPTAEELGIWDDEEDDDSGETYDEIFNELEDD